MSNTSPGWNPESGPLGAFISSSWLSRCQITPKESKLKTKFELISKPKSTQRKAFMKRVGDLYLINEYSESEKNEISARGY